MITIHYDIPTTRGVHQGSFTTFEGATVYHLKHFIGYSPLKLAVFSDLTEGKAPLGHATLLVDGGTYYVLQHGIEYSVHIT